MAATVEPNVSNVATRGGLPGSLVPAGRYLARPGRAIAATGRDALTVDWVGTEAGMPSGGPQHVTVYRHVRADGATVFTEDFAVRVTVAGSGSIAGQTFAVELFDPDGSIVAGPTVAVSDQANRVVTALFKGLTLSPGAYRVVIFRTDTGQRTETAWGRIWVADARG